MLENQAFGWLKTIARGNSENHTAIESCSDIPLLVSGVESDFEGLKSSTTAAATVAATVGDENDCGKKEGTGDSAAEEGAKTELKIDTTSTSTTTTNNTVITTRLDRIKTLLYEERSASSSAFAQRSTISYNYVPAIATSTYTSFTSQNLICTLLQHLELLPFEGRKSLAAIFNYLCVAGLDGGDAKQFESVSTSFGLYISQRPELMTSLVRNHEAGTPVDITLLCGAMLRSCLRHAVLYQWVLSEEQCVDWVYPFLERSVHDPNFDVGSDALETVRVMLLGPCTEKIGSPPNATEDAQYKQQIESITSQFLHRTYDEVIEKRVNSCLSPKSNYITRRMTLQLLSSILLNRSNYSVMIRYITSSSNLVIIMNLLRDPSPHITLDAFQVFKIFVANPDKPLEVKKILYDNKVKLVKYLEGLHGERERTDEQFRDEKGLVIGTLMDLEL